MRLLSAVCLLVVLGIYICQTSATSTKLQSMSNSTSVDTIIISTCSSSTCSRHGICHGDVCQCDNDYASEEGLATQCTYKRKSQLAALLLHIFLGQFGAGEFYIGHIGYGTGQLILGLIGFILPCCVTCAFKVSVTGQLGFMTCIICLVLCASLATLGWWIADIVLFAMNQNLDVNGFALTPM